MYSDLEKKKRRKLRCWEKVVMTEPEWTVLLASIPDHGPILECCVSHVDPGLGCGSPL